MDKKKKLKVDYEIYLSIAYNTLEGLNNDMRCLERSLVKASSDMLELYKNVGMLSNRISKLEEQIKKLKTSNTETS